MDKFWKNNHNHIICKNCRLQIKINIEQNQENKKSFEGYSFEERTNYNFINQSKKTKIQRHLDREKELYLTLQKKYT